MPQSATKKVKTEPVVKKEKSPSPIDMSRVKTECDEVSMVSVVRKARKTKQEIKKEPVDMFEDSPPIDSAEQAAAVPSATVRDQGNQTCPIKIEPCEIPVFKTELAPVQISSPASTPTTSQDAVPQPQPTLAASPEQPDAAASTAHGQQGVILLSDSDDDFSVDLMLDNLDYGKPKPPEGGGAPVKQEPDAEEWKSESTVAGAKAKAPTKRVTWNIQEPEGPQAEKSASSKCQSDGQ